MTTATERPDTSDMIGVHRVFRSSLASAPQFVASAAGDDERRELIANYYANLMAFLAVHHEGEEAIVFPRLLERAPAERAVVEEGEADHAAVVGLMAASTAAVVAWPQQGDAGGDEVLRCLAELESTLCPHLDREETKILPLAGEHLSAEEWGTLPGHALGNFSGDKVWLIMGLIRENFTQKQRDSMLEHMPPPARQMWDTMGESSFQALIAEVRRDS